MTDLISRLQVAPAGSRELSDEVLLGMGWETKEAWGRSYWVPPEGLARRPNDRPNPTRSLDDALALLPSTACNHQLFSFGGEREWGFGFADTAQLMGERAATEEIERMRTPTGGLGHALLAGPARVYLAKAIADHFIEFNCPRAASHALAVCVTALKSKEGR